MRCPPGCDQPGALSRPGTPASARGADGDPKSGHYRRATAAAGPEFRALPESTARAAPAAGALPGGPGDTVRVVAGVLAERARLQKSALPRVPGAGRRNPVQLPLP